MGSGHLDVRPRVAHVVVEWTAKQGHVAAGLGVALVPARAVYAATERGRSSTTATEAFVAALREAAARVPGQGRAAA